MQCDPAKIGTEIETILADLEASAPEGVAAKAEQLVALLMELYGSGLSRMVEISREVDAGGELVKHFAGDALVGSLLVLHDLHPDDTETRVVAALDQVRPYLGSHAGGVQLLGVVDGVARLRLEGSCDGCPSSLVTVKMAIEQAIEKAAPEVRVEVEGVTDQPATSKGPGSNGGGPQFIELKPPPLTGEWAAADDLPEVAEGQLRTAVVEGTSIALCMVDGVLLAYRDQCPSCRSGLAGATLVGDLLGCPGCDQRYDVRLAGRSKQSRELHLDPLPLLGAAGNRLRVAIPVVAP